MAPPVDDDFDIGEMDAMELDQEERALLAGSSSHGTSNTYSAPQANGAAQAWNQRQGGSGPTRIVAAAMGNSVSRSNTSHYFSTSDNDQPKSINNSASISISARQDDFEEFENLGDADLLLNNDIFDDITPSATAAVPPPPASARANFFAPRLPPPPQQQQQQQQQQNRPPAPAPAPQPTKFFSIFGGAQKAASSKPNNPALERTASGSTTSNNSMQGINIMQRQGPHNSKTSPYFTNNSASSTGPQNASTSNHPQTMTTASSVIPRSDPQNDFAEDIFRSPEAVPLVVQPPTHHAIDQRAILTWQYPINYSKRDYQYNIIRRALFTNTLVSLPTGLGKTFIAAVVMLNFFRWFPKSKIIFMAPTKPLVNQQIEACFNICGIPQDQTVELTGQQNAGSRAEMWRKKRVIFCTPQVLQNDLKSNICPAEDIVCLVVDEAHRATGRYSYSEVVRILDPLNRDVRILALTATPGGDVKSVQSVVKNLKIAKIEMRTEDSMDLQKYVFRRSIQEMVVPCGRELGEIRDKFLRMTRPFLERLVSYNVIRTTDPGQLSRFILLTGRDAFITGSNNNPQQAAKRSFVYKQVGICMGLVYAYELLTIHGIRPFFTNMDPFSNHSRDEFEFNDDGHDIGSNDTDKPSLARKAMTDLPDFIRMMDSIRTKMKQPNFVSHPKLERLVGVVVQHFIDHQDEQDAVVKARAESAASTNTSVSESGSSNDAEGPLPQTRVMIFANYRESVEEINRVLEQHRPLVKVQSFVGQATAKGKKGITQKEQQKVVADFQKGYHNVLVATSIGEEGLDIGDVDLIICYDSHSSPIRMLQRMGRTGRKRKGKICLLLAEGQEEQKYRRSQTAYKSVQRAIAQGHNITYYPHSPRILPQGPPPACDLVHIDVPQYIAPTAGGRKRRKLGEDGPAGINSSGSIGLSVGMKSQNAYLDSDELARFQQKYRVPKREIRKISFQRACAKLLRNNDNDAGTGRRGKKKAALMTLDWTFQVGHSTRTNDFVNAMKQIAKARVEQSLAWAGRSSREDDKEHSDPHSQKMMALIERWGVSGTGLVEDSSSEAPILSRSKGKAPSVAGSMTKKKMTASSAYAHATLSDDDLDDLHAERHRPLVSHSASARRRRLLYDEEDDDDEDQDKEEKGNDVVDDDDSNELSDFTRSLFGTKSIKKSQPKTKRKVPGSGSLKTTYKSSDLGGRVGLNAGQISSSSVLRSPSAGAFGSTTRPMSFFRSISDDEVDKEIMGGLDGMFGGDRLQNDDDQGGVVDFDDYGYDSYVPEESPGLEHRRGPNHTVSAAASEPSLRLKAVAAVKAKMGFDFRDESPSCNVWYKADGRNDSEDRDDGIHMDTDPSKDDEKGSLSFNMLELPPVPQPGQWYRPPSPPRSSSPRVSSQSPRSSQANVSAILSNRAVEADLWREQPEAFISPKEEPEEEILFIESSQEEPEVDPGRVFGYGSLSRREASPLWSRPSMTTTVATMPSGRHTPTSAKESLSKASEVPQLGFVSARSLTTLSGTAASHSDSLYDDYQEKDKEKRKGKDVARYAYGHSTAYSDDHRDMGPQKYASSSYSASTSLSDQKTGKRTSNDGGIKGRTNAGSSGGEESEFGELVLPDDDSFFDSDFRWE
ncbi:hypothetical protein EDD11_000458 [Mortierella claussenii]|nr:hypothetical protein EDD11_000458 [Mortierella claussenii]